MLKKLLFFSILFFTTPLFCQYQLTGNIVDQKGDPLPFVNILINDSQTDGVTTDIQGRFNIEFKNKINQLTVSYLGYENLILAAPFPKPLTIVLTPTAYEFEEIIVKAGENPAHRIIRKAVENKALNDPEKLDHYTCQTYNKMVMGYKLETAEMEAFYSEQDTSKKRIQKQYKRLQKTHGIFGDIDLMIIESVSNRFFKNPHDLKEEVILNRVSGSTNLPFAALASASQPFSFYKDEILILEQAFLNPISKNSTKKYFFNLTDTLYQQQDTIFIIAFHPRKGKNFEGLEGQLYINTNQYAIQNIIAKPTKEHLVDFEITQKYSFVNQHWFPEQLHFELSSNSFSKAFAGIKMYGRSYISNVQFKESIEKEVFKEGEEVVIKEDAYSKNDSLWESYRLEPLSPKEQQTFTTVDSIGEKFKFDKWVNLIEVLSRNRLPLGIVDYNFENAIKINDYEGLRLGIGLTTNEKISKHFEVGGYYAYGFQDKIWKHGANLTLLFDKYRDNQLNFIYKKDITAPGTLEFVQGNNSSNSGLTSNYRNQLIHKGIHLQTYPIKYIQLATNFTQQKITPLYDYSIIGEVPETTNIFTELKIGLRYAYNEKFIRFFNQRISQRSRFPIVDFNYIKGFDQFLEGQWDYSKYLVSITHNFRRKALGETSYRLEAGYINNALPYAKLFNSFGSGFSSLNNQHAFQTMQFDEFLSDRFIHFFFRHDFSSLLFKYKKFKPRILVEHNLAIGNLQNPEIHQGIDFKTLEKGFFEAGLAITDILRFKYFNMAYIGLGAGVYYRYGAYQFDNFTDNTAIRMRLTFSY